LVQSADELEQRDVRIGGNVIGRLKPGVTIEQARADINAVARQVRAGTPSQKPAQIGVNVLSMQQRLTGTCAHRCGFFLPRSASCC
jgi:4-hydroxy-3-methylbut-2-en-1-yl diphosphate synthase IspG/GcpE